jgi:hypothetical protein
MGLLSAANRQRELSARFKKFVRDAYSDFYQIEDGSTVGSDFIFRARDTTDFAVVSAHLHRSQFASQSTVRSAAAQLQAAQFNAKARHAILILNTVREASVIAIAATYGVTVFDLHSLKSVAALSSTLLIELDDLQQEAVFFGEDSTLLTLENPPTAFDSVDREVDLEQESKGAALAADLLAVPASQGKPYEAVCERVVQYLFDDDLAAWNRQHGTVEGLHQFDLIARIRSKHDFWSCVQQRFQSQYVVFEFKNYAEKITQAQVYTTEKYLFPKALRATAIIISRMGPDDHALVASRGALREAGKLILHCSNDDLLQMLQAKDRGTDPSDFLLGTLDTMLMSLER